MLALVGHVLMEGLRQLVHEAEGGLLSGVIRGEDLDGRENVVEQLHEHDGGAGGDAAPAGEGQGRGHEEHPKLQSAACEPGGVGDMELDLLPGLCRVGYAPVALVMDAGDAFLRLEALDHREAREHVLEHAGVALLSVGDLLLRLGRPVGQDD